MEGRLLKTFVQEMHSRRVPWSDESARKATTIIFGVAFAKPQTTAPRDTVQMDAAWQALPY